MPRYLVDITRTVSRIGHGFATGIDRVERAYINEVLRRSQTSLFVVKLPRIVIVLNASAMADFLLCMDGKTPWGMAKIQDAVRLKIPFEQRQARSFLRKAGQIFPNVHSFERMVDLGDVTYLNVGHSNLSDAWFSAIRGAGCKDIRVFVHDMIPLDYPEFTAPNMAPKFQEKMQSAARFADQVICNSRFTEKRVKSHFSSWGVNSDTIVGLLGVEPLVARHTESPFNKPYFLILGTIEPRKNHTVLFQAWEHMNKTRNPQEIPDLRIVGRRGWNNEQAFDFLDDSPLVGSSIFEHPNLDDDNLAAALMHAQGLLFPSFVEGFGLPAMEAVQAGIPVLCSDIEIFSEILGNFATHLEPTDSIAWAEAIIKLFENSGLQSSKKDRFSSGVVVPSWSSHFRHVLG